MTRRSSEVSARGAPAAPAGDSSRVPLKLAPNGDILRENFTRERMESLRQEMAQRGDRTLLTHDQREADRARFLRRWDRQSDLWVFGYGSLMWNPAIHVAETQPAKLFGLHRAFCLQLTLGRGSHERPGLMLALDHGGSCRGIAHRISPDLAESETEILWMREMLSGAYRPVWTRIRLPDGSAPRYAFTFVINRRHTRYAGRLDFDAVARRIADAEGQLGTNRAYLYRTVERLDALGVGDGPMHRLCEKVRALAGD